MAYLENCACFVLSVVAERVIRNIITYYIVGENKRDVKEFQVDWTLPVQAPAQHPVRFEYYRTGFGVVCTGAIVALGAYAYRKYGRRTMSYMEEELLSEKHENEKMVDLENGSLAGAGASKDNASLQLDLEAQLNLKEEQKMHEKLQQEARLRREAESEIEKLRQVVDRLKGQEVEKKNRMEQEKSLRDERLKKSIEEVLTEMGITIRDKGPQIPDTKEERRRLKEENIEKQALIEMLQKINANNERKPEEGSSPALKKSGKRIYRLWEHQKDLEHQYENLIEELKREKRHWKDQLQHIRDEWEKEKWLNECKITQLENEREKELINWKREKYSMERYVKQMKADREKEREDWKLFSQAKENEKQQLEMRIERLEKESNRNRIKIDSLEKEVEKNKLQIEKDFQEKLQQDEIRNQLFEGQRKEIEERVESLQQEPELKNEQLELLQRGFDQEKPSDCVLRHLNELNKKRLRARLLTSDLRREREEQEWKKWEEAEGIRTDKPRRRSIDRKKGDLEEYIDERTLEDLRSEIQALQSGMIKALKHKKGKPIKERIRKLIRDLIKCKDKVLAFKMRVSIQCSCCSCYKTLLNRLHRRMSKILAFRNKDFNDFHIIEEFKRLFHGVIDVLDSMLIAFFCHFRLLKNPRLFLDTDSIDVTSEESEKESYKKKKKTYKNKRKDSQKNKKKRRSKEKRNSKNKKEEEEDSNTIGTEQLLKEREELQRELQELRKENAHLQHVQLRLQKKMARIERKKALKIHKIGFRVNRKKRMNNVLMGLEKKRIKKFKYWMLRVCISQMGRRYRRRMQKKNKVFAQFSDDQKMKIDSLEKEVEKNKLQIEKDFLEKGQQDEIRNQLFERQRKEIEERVESLQREPELKNEQLELLQRGFDQEKPSDCYLRNLHELNKKRLRARLLTSDLRREREEQEWKKWEEAEGIRTDKPRRRSIDRKKGDLEKYIEERTLEDLRSEIQALRLEMIKVFKHKRKRKNAKKRKPLKERIRQLIRGLIKCKDRVLAFRERVTIIYSCCSCYKTLLNRLNRRMSKILAFWNIEFKDFHIIEEFKRLFHGVLDILDSTLVAFLCRFRILKNSRMFLETDSKDETSEESEKDSYKNRNKKIYKNKRKKSQKNKKKRSKEKKNNKNKEEEEEDSNTIGREQLLKEKEELKREIQELRKENADLQHLNLRLQKRMAKKIMKRDDRIAKLRHALIREKRLNAILKAHKRGRREKCMDRLKCRRRRRLNQCGLKDKNGKEIKDNYHVRRPSPHLKD